MVEINVLICKYVFSPPPIFLTIGRAERQILGMFRFGHRFPIISSSGHIPYFSMSLSPTKISSWVGPWRLAPFGVQNAFWL